MPSSTRVTWRSFQAGALRMFLPSFATFPFGIGFGVAAAQKGLSAFEVGLMSFTVFAGTKAHSVQLESAGRNVPYATQISVARDSDQMGPRAVPSDRNPL